jgi:hypothetical protein
MPSAALQRWSVDRAIILDEIERAHRAVRGSGPGVRVASLQINQAYAVLLSAQFQAFCRELHTECTDSLVAPIVNPDFCILVRESFVRSGDLDRKNPNPGTIGSDFNRFGVGFWPVVTVHHPTNPSRKAVLDELNEWRNAIAHQSFKPAMLGPSGPALTLSRVRAWCAACNGLASSFDGVMRVHLVTLLGHSPW